MPKPKKGESKKDYVSRCIPTRQREGKDKDVKQSAAVCYSMYDNKNKKKTKESFDKKIDSIFNEKNMAVPTKETPVPQELKPFIKRLGKIDFSPLKEGKPIYIQWMSGGKLQKRGNLSIFFEFNNENAQKYLDGAIDMIPDPGLLQRIVDKFDVAYGSVYYSFDHKGFVVDEYWGPKPERDLLINNSDNPEKGNFFIQVKGPKDSDAMKFGKLMDDDMYVYEYNEDDTIKSVRFRNMKSDGKSEKT
jgi:hypothetical protein